MNLLKLNPRHFWSSDSGLTGLLVFVLGYLIVVNALNEFNFGRLAARFFFSLIVVAGVLTTFKQKWLHRVVIVLAVALLILSWFEEIRPGHVLAIINTGLGLLYLGFLLATLVLQVFRQGTVTGHRICGAIVVYLLLGAIWALLYQLVALTIPEAFRLTEEFAGNPEALQRQLSYFSFITLTTTGYGDITPVHPVARLLVMFEALAGQLYLAVTLARLVALAVMHQNEKK
jgi:Ion channel